MMKITRNDVPEYLRMGAFFQTLDVTDSEEFEVPSDCFKPDLSVESAAALEFLLRSLRFWAIAEFPEEIVLFLIDPECSLLTELSTNFEEFSHWWTMIGKLKSTPNEDSISTAIEVGFGKATVQSLHEIDCFPLTSEACVAAATRDALDILTYLHEQKCPWDEKTTNAAAEIGNLQCLTYAHNNGCALSKLCMILSAKKGSLECLQFLHQSGQTFSISVSVAAARHGHLHCLQYAHQNGCAWDRRTTQAAAKNGHLECLKYAYCNGCSMFNTTNAAIHGGSWKCFYYTLFCVNIAAEVQKLVSAVIVICIMRHYKVSIMYYPSAIAIFIMTSLSLFIRWTRLNDNVNTLILLSVSVFCMVVTLYVLTKRF